MKRQGSVSGRTFAGADLSGTDLRDAHLAGADLTGARLQKSDLRGVDLRGARFVDAFLDDADLRDAVVDGANLDSASLVRLSANGARFEGARFELADLAEADFRFTDLSRATLTDANLTRAMLDRAVLRDADLIGAQLGGASLRGAVLLGANLRESHLEGADLAGARFGFTVMAASDLSRVRGLERVVHDGPSTIGIDAFLLSKGEIPDSFLEGSGLSALTVEYLKSVAAAEQGMLVGDTLLLRFAAADRPRARRLRAYLRAGGFPTWYFREVNELSGRHNPDRRHRIRVRDRTVVLLSKAATEDPVILRGTTEALAAESDEGRALVWAARLDGTETSDLESALGDRVVADFRHADWDDPGDPVFHRELEHLIGALSAPRPR